MLSVNQNTKPKEQDVNKNIVPIDFTTFLEHISDHAQLLAKMAIHTRNENPEITFYQKQLEFFIKDNFEQRPTLPCILVMLTWPEQG